MNKKQSSPFETERRNFLKGIAVVGGVAALSSLSVGESAGLTTKSDTVEKSDDASTQQSKGYHETPHIEAYYNSLRD